MHKDNSTLSEWILFEALESIFLTFFTVLGPTFCFNFGPLYFKVSAKCHSNASQGKSRVAINMGEFPGNICLFDCKLSAELNDFLLVSLLSR